MSYGVNLRQRYAACVLVLLLFALSPAYASQLTSGVSFAQVSFTDASAPQQYSQYGQVFIDYTMLYGEGYINIERYNNGKAAGWVVRNLPVINGSVLSGYSTMFDLGASGYESSLDAYVDFSPAPLADDSSLRNQVAVTYQLGQAEYPLSAPAPKDDPPVNFELRHINEKRVIGHDCDGLTLITFTTDDVNRDGTIKTKEFQTQLGSKTVCVQNLTRTQWKDLKFSVAEKQKKDVTGKDDIAKHFFKNKPKPCVVNKQQGVDFSGTNDGDQKGIPNGTTFKVLAGNFDKLGKGEENNITIYPSQTD